jgi:chaperonin GroES
MSVFCRMSGKIVTSRIIFWHKTGFFSLFTGLAREMLRVLRILTTNLLSLMANVSIRPLADRVLVEPAAAEEKTSFGIIIPDTAKEKPQKGQVVAVGNGKKDEPLTVKVGDTVLYGKYAGTEISVEGKEYLIMRESDIFAVL